ncbi:Type I phosphodiesterase / nucleotide pyrophosphatase [uncultured archaeon]|nr:Type I phosphodiesterase / nucleotide pyrophosphatase [uncultured archaeon]
MRHISQVDIAPTIARVLGITIRNVDGRPIRGVEDWKCRNAVLIIVDSLGYDLYRWLEPDLKHIPALARYGLLIRAEAVSTHTSPSIASILSGILPEHHRIFDKESAGKSSMTSIPEAASSQGLRSAVIMEKCGAEVYKDKIEITSGIPDCLSPEDFDQESCRKSLEALASRPRLMISYFIGIDKTVHMGLGPKEIRNAAISIDRCAGEIASAASNETLLVLCGDHPVHAGRLKRSEGPYFVALILAKINRGTSQNLDLI